MRVLTCVVLLFAVFTLVTVSPAQQSATTPVPNLITDSGTLIPSSDTGVPAKTVGVTFAIYRQPDAGAALWLQTQNVTLDSSGHYSVHGINTVRQTLRRGIVRRPVLANYLELRWEEEANVCS